MSTPPNTLTQEDISRKLHLFLEKEGGEVVEDSSVLLKELLVRYPTYEELTHEGTKLENLKKEKEREKIEKVNLKDGLEKATIPVPQVLNEQIEALTQAIELLTERKKLIEENTLHQIATAHYTTLDTIHSSSLEKIELEALAEKTKTRLGEIDETLGRIKEQIEIKTTTINTLSDNKTKIIHTLTTDGIEDSSIVGVTQAYTSKIQIAIKEKEAYIEANERLLQEQSLLNQQTEEITKNLQSMQSEEYDKDMYTQLERFLGKEKLQQHQQWEQEIAPTLKDIMSKRPSSYNSKLLEHLMDTSRFQNPKYDQEDVRWFKEAQKKLEEQHPSIPEEVRTQFLLAQITPGTTNSLLDKSLKVTNPQAQTYREKVEQQQKERAKLDAFAEQFTNREKRYTDEGKEKIKSALGYTGDENQEFYFLTENGREQPRRVPFATIDDAIQNFLKEIQDCLASGYMYNEQYGYSFSANYTEKVKLLTSIITGLENEDPKDNTDKIREFMQAIMQATGAETGDENKEGSCSLSFRKYNQKPSTTLPSKNTLTHLERQVGEFSTKTEALLSTYYTNLPQINNRLVRTQDSNTTYPLPKYMSIQDIRNTTDTGYGEQKTPSQSIRTANTSVTDQTRYIENYTKSIEKHEQDRIALLACVGRLNNAPEKGVPGFKTIDSAELIRLINTIENIQTAFYNNNITITEKLNKETVKVLFESITKKVESLEQKIKSDQVSKATCERNQADALVRLNTPNYYIAYYGHAFDSYVLQLKKAELCAYSSDQASKTPDENFPIYLQHKAQIEQDKQDMLAKITTFFAQNSCTIENYTAWRKEFDNIHFSVGTGLNEYKAALEADSKTAEKEHEAFIQSKEQVIKASDLLARQLKEHNEQRR